MRYVEVSTLDELVQLLDDGFTSCSIGKSAMLEIRELKAKKFRGGLHVTDSEYIIMLEQTMIEINRRLDFYLHRNYELQHDKDLLALRIIELEKKIEKMCYDSGE